MITEKRASELEAGDVFSTDGYRVITARSIGGGLVAVEASKGSHVKAATLDADRLLPIWHEHRRCFCPGDCNCHFPHRVNYCGCKQHGAPVQA